MAEYLGIDADSEGSLMDIARMAVAAPTPSGWQQLDNNDGFAVFRCCPLYSMLTAWWQCPCRQNERTSCKDVETYM